MEAYTVNTLETTSHILSTIKITGINNNLVSVLCSSVTELDKRVGDSFMILNWMEYKSQYQS